MGLNIRFLKIDEALIREALLPAFDAARRAGRLAPLVPFLDRVSFEERTGRSLGIKLHTRRRGFRKVVSYTFTHPPAEILQACFEHMAGRAVFAAPMDYWDVQMPAGWHALTMAGRGLPKGLNDPDGGPALVAVEEVPALRAMARRMAKNAGTAAPGLHDLAAFMSDFGPSDCAAVLRRFP